MTHTDLSRDEVQRYSRHILLPQVGKAGQRRLKEASVLIVGAGGLGSPAAMYLAAAGVGRIGLVDYDAVEGSNLQRQVIHGEGNVGAPKVVSARRRLLELNPALDAATYDEPFTAQNAERILGDAERNGYDLVLDCSDNFATRYLINDLCVLHGKADVFGAVFRFDGQASVFDARRGPCYRCLFPEPPMPGTFLSCGVSGVLGVLPGTIGTIQATEAIKHILGIGESLVGRLLLYSALDMTFDSVRVNKNPACKICGESPSIRELIDYDAFCGTNPINQPAAAPLEGQIPAPDLQRRLEKGEKIQLLDVRETQELEIIQIEDCIHIPESEIGRRLDELTRDAETVVICRSGIRAARVRERLLQAGFGRVFVLEGGVLAWQAQIDSSLAVY